MSERRAFFGGLLAAITGGAWLAGVRPAQAATQSDTPFVGEMRLFAGTFAPSGWALCEGQILNINQFNTLFNLIGTTYGGDGFNTFALPDLRGRAPMHAGNGFSLGELAGTETVTLIATQIPAHTHAAMAGSVAGNSDNPSGHAPARNAAGVQQYGSTADTNLAATAMLSTGGSGAHNNLQPFLGISIIISLDGVFPSQ